MNNYEFLNVSKEENKLITEIADRAIKNCDIFGTIIDDRMGLEMDLMLAHYEFNLRLEDLLLADDFNFSHDIMGIQNTIDRRNFCFTNHFLPRYSNPNK